MVTPRLLVAGLLTLGLASAAAALAQRMSASVAPPARLEHRGFNFTSWSRDEYMSAGAEASLRRLAATGANAVALNPTWYQDSRRSTRIEPDDSRTPTDEAVAVAVARARALGLEVFLRPVVDTRDGAPRATLMPRSARAWFRSYRRFIAHYAGLGQRLGVDMLSVGLEYRTLDGPARTGQWRRVIADVRNHFGGRLTYGANGEDAWTGIRFWNALDVIGIDAYFPLSRRGTPSEAEIVRRWSRYADASGVTHRYVPRMGALAARHRKPVVLTELGYPSAADAAATPWKEGGRYSGAAQQRALDGALEALARQPWFAGLYVWEWRADPAAGGAGDTGHTLQGKPAERATAAWYGGSLAP